MYTIKVKLVIKLTCTATRVLYYLFKIFLKHHLMYLKVDSKNFCLDTLVTISFYIGKCPIVMLRTFINSLELPNDKETPRLVPGVSSDRFILNLLANPLGFKIPSDQCSRRNTECS